VVRAEPLWAVVVFGFLLFRVLDIIKVPPARQIDRDWHGAWGILLDDVVSGLYASGLVWAIVSLMS
jgi:phosphatidylglycerophosphatase A